MQVKVQETTEGNKWTFEMNEMEVIDVTSILSDHVAHLGGIPPTWMFKVCTLCPMDLIREYKSKLPLLLYAILEARASSKTNQADCLKVDEHLS